MMVSKNIKELIPAHFYIMCLKFFLQTLVQISAAAPFPYLPFVFNQPNNGFFLYCCVSV
jgi:hypothetical protein